MEKLNVLSLMYTPVKPCIPESVQSSFLHISDGLERKNFAGGKNWNIRNQADNCQNHQQWTLRFLKRDKTQRALMSTKMYSVCSESYYLEIFVNFYYSRNNRKIGKNRYVMKYSRIGKYFIAKIVILWIHKSWNMIQGQTNYFLV